MSFNTVAEIRVANIALGHHFFDRDTLQFFNSAVYNDVYGGRYFITSEQFVAPDGEEFPRHYTIRMAHEDGRIETVDLPRYQTLADAQARVEILVSGIA